MLPKLGGVLRSHCWKLSLVFTKPALSLIHPVVCWWDLSGRAKAATVGQAQTTSSVGCPVNDVSQVPGQQPGQVPGQAPCTPYTNNCGGCNPDHVSRAAVSLVWLRQFVAKHRVAERNLTTEELTEQIVMPLTKGGKCRLTQLLLDDPDQAQHVSQGRPFYFISHAWSRPFMETLAMVERHFAPDNQEIWRRSADGQQALPVLDAANVFMWFDMFAINQHKPLQSGDLPTLGEAVRNAEGTFMVLDRAGTPLKRIWCLYEAWQSSMAGPGKLRILSYGIDFEDLKQVCA
ncbi:hypothetical protein PLESTB_001620200 [Pleodorina starrii]|uniref:Uncharacterized protein n=1 Tax=Pleodorina starrii TaxID=330485 RepID=A0A9W6F9C9_9CHLO|nr:hypothetical protein PLESTM_001890900 [Pleodorina starrii]GLC60496.1 hypothetical protein PLESTB_001620200 [Pleodorina starrii]